MTVEEIKQKFDQIEKNLDDVCDEIEGDAHLDFIESLKQYVNKY